MKLIEKVARELCRGSGVNPDQIGGCWDLGRLPRDQAAWTEWADEAEIQIKASNADVLLETIKRLREVLERIVMASEFYAKAEQDSIELRYAHASTSRLASEALDWLKITREEDCV